MKDEEYYTKDKFLSKALERLETNYFSKRKKAENIVDFNKLKDAVSSIKEKSASQIKENTYSFIKIFTEKGIDVRFAENSTQAKKTIYEILRKKNVKNIVKSKSLTTEEIDLDEFLIDKGYDVAETDLGEWLVQIKGERPTHMTAPAIHLSKEKIAELLNSKFAVNLSDDPKTLVDFAKKQIRKYFSSAQCGIFGANAVSLEDQNIFIVSNEGNIQNVIRQDLTICVISVDKIVSKTKDAFTILELLPPAATGQLTTSFIDVIKKPFGEFHIILLDNNRIDLSTDETFKNILKCIHCGACQNACPVYSTVGGAFFRGKIYAGPIGILMSYFLSDTPNIRDYANLCTGCMACDEICSSRINLQSLILEIKAANTKRTRGIKGLIINHMENRYEFLRIGLYISHFLFSKEFKTYIKPIDNYLGIKYRPLPKLNKHSFDITKTKTKGRIYLFAGCSTNFFYKNIGMDALSVAEKLSIELNVIKQKSCCGAPAWYNGEKKSAEAAASINVNYLSSLKCDKILFLDPHCAHMIKRDYPSLLNNNKALEISKKVMCASDFFIDQIKNSGTKIKHLGGVLSYHHPCHLKRGLNVSEKLEDFLRHNEPNFAELAEADKCCGFAGSYSMIHQHIAGKLLQRKVSNIKNAGLQMLITACPGCIMQISGGLKVVHSNVEVIHFITYLNKILQEV